MNEKDKQVIAMIYRSGDVSHKSTVRCYTRQGSAQVTMDYEERPNTDDSAVVFLPGKFISASHVLLNLCKEVYYYHDYIMSASLLELLPRI